MELLVAENVAPSDRVAVKGRSAGGLVAGNFFTGYLPSKLKKDNVTTVKPKVVIGNVPFIDPIYDLMDSNIPWTPYEWYDEKNSFNRFK